MIKAAAQVTLMQFEPVPIGIEKVERQAFWLVSLPKIGVRTDRLAESCEIAIWARQGKVGVIGPWRNGRVGLRQTKP